MPTRNGRKILESKFCRGSLDPPLPDKAGAIVIQEPGVAGVPESGGTGRPEGRPQLVVRLQMRYIRALLLLRT